jgi:glycerol uptake facilitator-like aquaporin
VGTALLLAAIVGSGIMGDRLAGGNAAIALLANTIATGATLTALIVALGPISGAHFNPVVTLVQALEGALGWRLVAPYVIAQVAGGVAGVAAAHVMFGEPALQASHHARAGGAMMFSELVATFGLVSVIRGSLSARPEATPIAVGLYITGAYWFTASTSFANPAVTIARSLTDTFSGIRPADVGAFIVAQTAGALAAAALFRWLLPDARVPARDAVTITATDARAS